MRPRSRFWYLAPLGACPLLSAPAPAQVIPFSSNLGPGLSAENNRLLFESVARLNAAEPSRVGRSDTWSNPQTKSYGSSTILDDTKGMPVGWYGVPLGAPSHHRSTAPSS